MRVSASGEESSLPSRPDWDSYFLELASQVGTRATCDRGRSGCVIVRDRQILCTGYVGSPPGLEHCDDVGHLLRQVIDEDSVARTHCVRTIHAEQNALLQAAKTGVSLAGATLYCTMEPCRTCAMFIASVGIARVIAAHRYHAGADSRVILGRAGVALEAFDEAPLAYPRQSEKSEAERAVRNDV